MCFDNVKYFVVAKSLVYFIYTRLSTDWLHSKVKKTCKL